MNTLNEDSCECLQESPNPIEEHVQRVVFHGHSASEVFIAAGRWLHEHDMGAVWGCNLRDNSPNDSVFFPESLELFVEIPTEN